MRSTIEVLSALYRILDIEPVTSSLSGKIYIGNPPYTGQSEDISVNCLTNEAGYLQIGFCNVNIHAPQTLAGRPPLKRFREIVEVVGPLLENAQNNGHSFRLVDDKGFFPDNDRDGMYFYNLRLEHDYVYGKAIA